ncbi:unnamed protein product [Scytosiphon promiscuus]
MCDVSSRCVGKGEGNMCIYSNRRARTRTTYRKRRATTLANTEAAGVQTTKLEPYRGSVDMVLKRCRLSASPATGLVGMEENFFLSDFFSCVGFLPLTTESDIREAIVKIMTSATHQRPPDGEGSCMEGKLDTIGGIENAMEHGRFHEDPSLCTFWSAVAIGALAKGRPIESVERYLRLAREGLRSYTGPTNVEVLKAWTILGYLYFFVGDQAKFHEYLQLSDIYVSDMVEKGSGDSLPVGFPEVVKHGETIKLFTGIADTAEVESLLSQDVPFPEVCDMQTEAQVCKYMTSTYRAFELRIYRNLHCSRGAALRAINAEAFDGGALHQCGAGHQSNEAFIPSNWNLLEVRPDLLPQMMETLKEHMLGFGQLEAAVDRPGIRAGIGGLVINGTLFLTRAIKGDARGALQRLERCIEVLERYPGLTRTAMGTHMSHVMISIVAKIDDPRARELYDKLRATCNLTRSPGSLLFPALEEWPGMSAFCDNLPCRWIEALMSRKMLALHLSPEVSDEWGSTSGAGALDNINISGLGRSTGQPAAYAGVTGSDACPHREDVVETDPVAAAAAAEAILFSPASDCPIDEDMPDNVVAAEDWLEVTHAMLNCIDP